MGRYYEAQVLISRQEDGLWRAEVPGLQGCRVDAKTLEETLSQLQEAIAMMVDVYLEEGWPLPSSLKEGEGSPETALLPIVLQEYVFKRRTIPKLRVKASRG